MGRVDEGVLAAPDDERAQRDLEEDQRQDQQRGPDEIPSLGMMKEAMGLNFIK